MVADADELPQYAAAFRGEALSNPYPYPYPYPYLLPGTPPPSAARR